MSDSDTTSDTLPQRLCSEVQLFDLCELDSCRYKVGRFCSDPALLSRFEKIADDDLRTSDRFTFENPDDLDADEDGYNEEGFDEEDSEFERDHSGSHDDAWQNEE